MKILAFTRKTLLEYLREPLLWGLLLAFPPLLVAIMYLAFGQPQQNINRTLRVLVINRDQAMPTFQGGTELVRGLQEMTFEGQPLLNIELLDDEETGRTILLENRAALLLVIPPDFSQALLADSAAQAEGEALSSLRMIGNPGAFNYIFARSIIADSLRAYLRQAAGQPETIQAPYEFIPGTGKMSDFDISTPGVIVFGLLFLVISTATTLVRENVANTLQRLRLAHLHAGHMLLGVSLAQMLIAAIQTPLSFGIAIWFGFGSSGNLTPASLVLSMGVCLLFSVSVIGLGLGVAAFCRNDGEASNLAMIPLVPMAFLSGAIYPMPAAPLFEIGGQVVEVYDLMSSTHAAEIMRRILIYGESPAEMGYAFCMLALLSGAYLGLGILLYQRKKLAINPA